MLNLSFKLNDDFYVQDQRFIFVEIKSREEFSVLREQDGKVFKIFDGSPVEIWPKVTLRVGLRGQNHLARAGFVADKSIEIYTGENYRSK